MRNRENARDGNVYFEYIKSYQFNIIKFDKLFLNRKIILKIISSCFHPLRIDRASLSTTTILFIGKISSQFIVESRHVGIAS